MAKNRDDFSEKIIKQLERRVNGFCSNPEHRAATSGPSTKDDKANSIGVAAHITAAAPGGPRYAPTLSQQERKHINNAIWLCSNCATMIDKDPERYTVEILRQWKKAAEQEALEELGQKPISRKTHEQLKAVVLRDLPLNRISDAVSTMCQLTTEKYKELDPRFDVTVSHQAGSTSYTFSPTEPVSFAANIASEYAKEFQEKFHDLLSYGKDLEIDATAITLTGSKIFELTNNKAIKFVLSTNLRKEAVTKIAVLENEAHPGFSLDDIQGKLIGGSKTVTFSGSTFRGLLSFEFTYELHKEGRQNCTVSTETDFSSWTGKTLCSLPYFNKIFQFYEALFQKNKMCLDLEIDGEKILSGRGNNFAEEEHVGRVYSLLRYVRNVREILKFIGTDVSFTENVHLTSDDVEDVEYFYNLLIKHKEKHGIQLGMLNLKVIPYVDGLVQDSLRTMMTAESTAIRIEQSYSQPLNLYGVKLPLPRIAIYYSKMHVENPINLEQITPGESIELKLLPLEDCTMHVQFCENDSETTIP
jgi:hypothetical protein